MSNRTLLIAVLVALGLGVVTLLVLKKEAKPADLGIVQLGERLLELDGAKVKQIVIEQPAAGAAAAATIGLDRDAKTAGQWMMTFGKPTGTQAPGSTAWRVDPDRVRALLRVLGTITAAGRPEPGAKVGENPAQVTLTLDNGSTIELKLASRTLGGQGLVEIVAPAANFPSAVPALAASGATSAPLTRMALTSDALHGLFIGEGPRAWRDPSLLPGVMSQASRVRLVNPQGSVALGKVNGKWGLTEPLSAPADTAAVQRLLQTLEGLRIARFYDEAVPDSTRTGLESPVARVIIESDVRSVGASDAVSVSTTLRELLIGDGIDPANKQRFASIDGGATVVAVEALPLAEGLSVNPISFVSRAATDVAGPDIGLLMFVAETAAPAGAAPPASINMGFLRRVDGWLELRTDGTQVAQDPKRTDDINALLRFLTTEPSGSVSLAPPAGYQALGKLSLRTAGDAPLDELEIGRSAGVGVAVKSGRVYRAYSTVPELFKVVLGPIEPNPGRTPDGQPAQDVTK